MADVAVRGMHAWVDESITTSPTGVVPFYLLAAALGDPGECDDTRAQLRGLVPRGRERLHWRDESEPLRRKISATVSGCDVATVVVIGMGLDRTKQERARRLCMERLFYELEAVAVEHAWLENRTPSLNRADMRMVDALRGKRVIQRLRVDIAKPSEEPMLWVPDAVAGAVTAARKGAPQHRDVLGDLVRELEIQL